MGQDEREGADRRGHLPCLGSAQSAGESLIPVVCKSCLERDSVLDHYRYQVIGRCLPTIVDVSAETGNDNSTVFEGSETQEGKEVSRVIGMRFGERQDKRTSMVVLEAMMKHQEEGRRTFPLSIRMTRRPDLKC